MKIRDVLEILDAQLCCGEELLDVEVVSGCGADLMSDVLAFAKDQPVLMTGLTNLQVVRTADMMDIRCIVFVRGKEPDSALIQLARSKDIAVIATEYGMYVACGKLYSAGLLGQ